MSLMNIAAIAVKSQRLTETSHNIKKKMTINSMLIFVIHLSLECCGQTKSETAKAREMVEDGMKYVKSDEAKVISKKIANEKVLTKQLAIKIDESNSAQLISGKDEIISTSNTLINLIDGIIFTIEKAHGKDKNGEILNKRESTIVNKVMFDEKMATKLKFFIDKSIESTMKIISENQIQLVKEELPLKLNLFMETNGKTWEEYNFQNMPFGAVIPIFSKFKNDIILNKLLVLEELSKKVKN